MGFNSASRAREEAGQALRTPGGRAQQCGAWDKVTDRLQLKKEECPYDYPRLSVEVSLWEGQAGLGWDGMGWNGDFCYEFCFVVASTPMGWHTV